ncbi:hypothetical protein [Nocardia sp. BMG51109]|uniref:hypothetical protein n=1 Tax=Nocardia sp. BMG51109 TaxID=1056816 RepID=UPI0012EC6760|nr:hypothetical protein [Nocardia sp. BMG51109]
MNGHDPVWLADMRWLAGYRHRVAEVAAALLEAFSESRTLIDGARSVGDPIAVLPVLYHLLWSRNWWWIWQSGWRGGRW